MKAVIEEERTVRLPNVGLSYALRRHFIAFHTSNEREITNYGHPPTALFITTPEAFSGVVLEKLVAYPENGVVPVFENAMPESIMVVLQNGLARFGGRYARSQERPQPVLAVVLVVM
jgi:hypothetical protein